MTTRREISPWFPEAPALPRAEAYRIAGNPGNSVRLLCEAIPLLFSFCRLLKRPSTSGAQNNILSV